MTFTTLKDLQIEKEHVNENFPKEIVIQSNAIAEVATYLLSRKWTNILIVGDDNTIDAAGHKVNKSLINAEFNSHITMVEHDHLGDVIADEASIIQVMIDGKRTKAEVMLAVGGGTIHDIVRFTSHMIGIPFISVPTAPSVDGFSSMGAPIIFRGIKKTYQTTGPDAIFADLEIIKNAPKELIAAGFGDMLAKYTSLFDWEFESIVTNEEYLEKSAELTRSALEECVKHVHSIAKGEEEGLYVLTSALITSGLAMLLYGKSHPASGAEHHLSHYWEMEFLKKGKRQLLHGAKVGVACMEMSHFYHELAKKDQTDGLYSVVNNWVEIRNRIAMIPTAAELKSLLLIVGGPTSIEELGIKPELLKRSMLRAHEVRPNRFTLLKAYNEQREAQ